MAEVKAGQADAQQDDAQQQDAEDKDAPDDQQDDQQQRQQASKTYTQDEVDRILGKVRKNARYLGRKEAESELLRQGVTPRQAAAAVDKPAASEDQEPKREEFEDYETYLRALGRWEGRKGAREEHVRVGKEAEERSRVEQEKRAATEFKKRANTLMDEFPDFGNVIEEAEGVMITDTMGREIQDSPVGPRILYELAKNPEEAARIAELAPKAQVREILKLESRYEAEAANKAKGKEKDGTKDDAEDSKQEDAGDDEGEDKQGDDAEDKGKDAERRADGTFKPQKKRPAPDPIEPGGGRRADTGSLPSDKDDIDTWMRKEAAREKREGRR